mgnify:CR=1 FL=1
MKRKASIILMAGLVASLLALSTASQADDLSLNVSLAEKKVAIIYASRYGSTAQTANWIAEGMEGKAVVKSVKEVGDLAAYDLLILGSGIYFGQLHQDMLPFLESHKAEIKEKLLALFVVCGAPVSSAQRYLDMFASKCEATPAFSRAFNGWQKKELLSPEDYKTLEDYYKRSNRPFENYDHTDKSKCLEFGKEILKALSPSWP